MKLEIKKISGSQKTPVLLSVGWVSVWFSAAVLLRFLTPAPEHDFSRILRPASVAHPFGFDVFGRDILSITLRASINSVAFSAAAVVISTLLGLIFGTALAFSKGWTHGAGSKLLSGLLAFPSLLFALAWAAINGPGWDTLVFALLIGTTPGFARFIEVRAKELLAEDYILAATSLGAHPVRIATAHVFPALMPICAVKVPNLFAHALLAEATLSFLGIGAPVGRDTWGSLLAQGREYLIEAPHIAWGAGLPLVLTVLALQILSESKTRLE